MITTDIDGKENIYPNEPPIQLLPERKLMSQKQKDLMAGQQCSDS